MVGDPNIYIYIGMLYGDNVIICLVKIQIAWCFCSDFLVGKDGFTHKCWLFAETMSKREKSRDGTQTEWAGGWTSEHVFLCSELMSVFLMVLKQKKNSTVSLHLYHPCSSPHYLHASELFT